MNLFGLNGNGAAVASPSVPAKIASAAGSALTALFGPPAPPSEPQLARPPSVFENPLVVLGVLALGGYLIYSIFAAKGR